VKTRKRIVLNHKDERMHLKRDRDGFGITNAVVVMPLKKKAKKLDDTIGKNGEIRIGHPTVGLNLDRWVVTTPVTQILSVNKDKTEIKFKTKNSIYTLTAFIRKPEEETDG
jgi:hypothetical protein